ncbi:MAG: hypothetical protein MUC96_17480 [Myxococcaceae bacterium]|jgi:hypothetical protein|nr:hypothetical protein [Myxococcaceae bacterium]
MRPVLLGTAAVVLLAQGCALRPRYRDFVTAKTEGKQVQLQLTDGVGAPVPNAKVELSEWKNRLQLTTAADGTFTLPVEKKYLDENPVLVVQVPVGVSAYAVALWTPPPPPAPVVPATPPGELPPPAPAPAPSPTGTTP